jgi:D-alanine-D-alanine ligase
MSITALTRTLAELRMPATVLDPCERSFLRELLAFDVVMPAMHGPYGEDGRLQGLLDYVRRPYCGSGVAASAVAADKALCKLAMTDLGVATPRWCLADADGRSFASQCAQVMVKPRLGGSSVGMALVRAGEELEHAISAATAIDPVGALIEEFIPGLPVTVGLLELPAGVMVLPPLAVQPHGGAFYDAEAKLDAAGEHLVSYSQSGLPAHVMEQLKDQSLRLWRGLGCRGIARIDFMVTGTGTFALEVNTIPGLSYESNFASVAGQVGLSHGDIVLALLHEALRRSVAEVPLPVLAAGDFIAAQPPAGTGTYGRVSGSGVQGA